MKSTGTGARKKHGITATHLLIYPDVWSTHQGNSFLTLSRRQNRLTIIEFILQ